MKLSNRVYDLLKWTVMILLPACGTLYAALAAVWGWGASQEVVTTITAADTFLGALLGISTVNYRKDS